MNCNTHQAKNVTFFHFFAKNSENRPPKRPFRGPNPQKTSPVHQNAHSVDDWPSYPASTGYLILHHFFRPPKRPFFGQMSHFSVLVHQNRHSVDRTLKQTSLIHQTALFVDDTPPRHPKQETNRPLCRHTRPRPGI